MYMLELYRDNLIDLFGDTKNPAKLDIKKDKKVKKVKKVYFHDRRNFHISVRCRLWRNTLLELLYYMTALNACDSSIFALRLRY